MAKGEVAHSEMAYDRQIDGIKVIFDQSSPVPSRSRSRSSSGSKPSSGSGRSRARVSRRRRYRSSSSSSSSSSHSRSRSHPRCHRPSSRCRCDKHRRHGRSRQSPPRRERAEGSRSSSHKNKRAASPSSQSPPRTHRDSSRSGSSEHSVSLRLDDKGELVRAAKAIATTLLAVEKQELHESVKPVQEFKRVSLDTWVRQEPEKTQSQSDEEDSDDVFSRRMSPKRKTISFSINNSLVKPTLAAQSGAKVTSRVDSFDSRKPYGHWVRVKSGKSLNARKHTFSTTH
ncbi:hypothetical protein PBY51_010406 [Eleginops maclovinus]|uniref:Arginine/serine-rich protein 1 n=1 Tax=Eleginops maclovinus TaxID=56733 RepID=A0AAN8AJG7_ELEMC|nr:hypothetical protein PBY51_010406 [Eleginops maclovinus]